MLTVIDVLLACIALLIFLNGIFKSRRSWLCGRKEILSKDFFGVFQYLVGHKKILENTRIGTLHLLIFWGCIIPVLIVGFAQFNPVLPAVVSGILSFMLDILGIFVLWAILFFIVKAVKSIDTGYAKEKLLPLLVLLLIIISGFWAEGSRLSIVRPGFTFDSPVGWAFSVLSPASPVFMQVMIRIHLLGVLIFFALVPYTFMRHIPAGLQNIYHRKKILPGELNPVLFDRNPIGAQTVFDLSQKQLLDAQACALCGRCEDNCPAFISNKPLSPRKVMHKIFKQMDSNLCNAFFKTTNKSPLLASDIQNDEIWSCTTCMACIEHCPVFINPMQKIIDMRRHQVLDKGLLPKEARKVIRNMELFGDAQGKGPALRKKWADIRGVPIISKQPVKPDILLWVGCSGMFHPRYSNVAMDMARILTAGNINFAVLGAEEFCCGEPARKLGDEAVFKELVQKNIQAVAQYGVDKIVAICPHCFNTLKNEYPAYGGKYTVIPAIEFILELINEKRIVPKYPVHKKLTLHDPCYLGRANRIYDPLRQVMQALPGITLQELDRTRNRAFCCGGGGGRMWLHESLGENISTIRAKEIDQLQVDTVGTACPFCLTMIEDATTSLLAEDAPNVLDLIELTALSLGVENREIK